MGWLPREFQSLIHKFQDFQTFDRLPKSSRLRKSEVLADRMLDACCFAAANKRPDPFNSESTTLAARLQDSPTACVTNTSKRTI